MVCFTQHNFTFCGKQTSVYFPLLVKYYSDVPVNVFVTDPREKDAPVKEFKGKITAEWLTTVCTMGNVIDDSIICLETDRFWSEYACIKTLPKFVPKIPSAVPTTTSAVTSTTSTTTPSTEPTAPTTEEKGEKNEETVAQSLVKQIDELIRNRTDSGGHEIFHGCKFSPPVSWTNIVQALDTITETKDIARLLLCNETEAAIVVLKDRHTIAIGERGASDFMLPTFDIDDGFVESGFGGPPFPEFTAAFDAWKKTFTDSEGATWNDALW